MHMNYDLLPPLLSALAAKSPLVGIPVPGNAPLILNRTKLQAALRGVEPMYVTAEDFGQVRYLRVKGIAKGRIRTNMRMLSIPRTDIRRGQRNPLAESFWRFCDTKPAAPKPRGAGKIAALDRKIAKLKEAKLGMMRSLRWPKQTKYSDDDRRAVLNWYLDKPRRRDPKFRDPLKRINEGSVVRGWWLGGLLKAYKPSTPAERYAFLSNEQYIALREELRGLESIRATLT